MAHKALLAPCSISPKHAGFAHLSPAALTVCPAVTLPGSRNMPRVPLRDASEAGSHLSRSKKQREVLGTRVLFGSLVLSLSMYVTWVACCEQSLLLPGPRGSGRSRVEML